MYLHPTFTSTCQRHCPHVNITCQRQHATRTCEQVEGALSRSHKNCIETLLSHISQVNVDALTTESPQEI